MLSAGASITAFMAYTPLKSWVPIPEGSDFPLENLPFGVFTRSGERPHIGVAIGDHVLDLHELAKDGLFDGYVAPARELLMCETLNDFLAAGRPVWTATRERVQALLTSGNKEIRDRIRLMDSALSLRSEAIMHLPFAVGDYVDFYSSINHASNVGKIFRPDGEPLLPNYRHLPVAYHGRSSTIVPSGTVIPRPRGQMKAPGGAAPTFGSSKSLDFELEVGFVTGPGNLRNTPITTSHAREHIAGLVLVNDWSARDIQAWEYAPLGPFLGKSFATSISPWVVTLDALEPYRVANVVQEPPPLDYLHVDETWAYDLHLQVLFQSALMAGEGIAPVILSETNFRSMYWNMAQQLAHVTINGTTIRSGDLYASGTVSGPTADEYGSLLELSWGGTKPLQLANGEERTFLVDGDTIVLRGWCGDGVNVPRIGFGDVAGRVEAY